MKSDNAFREDQVFVIGDRRYSTLFWEKNAIYYYRDNKGAGYIVGRFSVKEWKPTPYYYGNKTY